jgi:UDP-glucosyl transferase 73C
MALNFFTAVAMLQQPVEKVFEELTPKPNCIISDMALPWTDNIARRFHIPRISFAGPCCFTLLCLDNVGMSNVLENTTSETDYFVVPNLPDHIEITKAQLPRPLTPDMEEFHKQVFAAEIYTYGIIMNTFEELEQAYVNEYKKARNDKVWCIGPVSLCNKDDFDKAQRGDKASVDEHHCLKWLDSWEPGSVVYACLGTLTSIAPKQLIELGLGLEASKKPFIWVLKRGKQSEEFEKWIRESGFEERTKGKSLLIRGWSPQTLILSHSAVGGFLTHCGWNSILEGICAGVPLITWPLMGDHFLNGKLAEQILKIAVRIRVEYPVKWGEEEKNEVLVKRENVKEAIDELMNGDESQGRRERTRRFGEMAKKAVEEGGSSHHNVALLIEDFKQQGSCREN